MNVRLKLEMGRVAFVAGLGSTVVAADFRIKRICSGADAYPVRSGSRTRDCDRLVHSDANCGGGRCESGAGDRPLYDREVRRTEHRGTAPCPEMFPALPEVGTPLAFATGRF